MASRLKRTMTRWCVVFNIFFFYFLLTFFPLATSLGGPRAYPVSLRCRPPRCGAQDRWLRWTLAGCLANRPPPTPTPLMSYSCNLTFPFSCVSESRQVLVRHSVDLLSSLNLFILAAAPSLPPECMTAPSPASPAAARGVIGSIIAARTQNNKMDCCSHPQPFI